MSAPLANPIRPGAYLIASGAVLDRLAPLLDERRAAGDRVVVARIREVDP